MNICSKWAYCGEMRHRLGRTIILVVAWSALMVVLAGCSQPGTSSSSPSTVTQAISTGNQETSAPTCQQTPTSSQAAAQVRFSPQDLTVNGIPVGATPQEAEQVLGVPRESKTDMDMVSGLDVLTCTYDGLHMIFMKGSKEDSLFHLKQVEVTGRGYVLARGLRVGDTASSAIQLFFHETKEVDYKGYTVLYGDPTLLDRQDTTSEIAHAYHNDREVHYLYMKSPYMTGPATLYDEMAILNLTIENQIITRVFWMLGAGAE